MEDAAVVSSLVLAYRTFLFEYDSLRSRFFADQSVCSGEAYNATADDENAFRDHKVPMIFEPVEVLVKRAGGAGTLAPRKSSEALRSCETIDILKTPIKGSWY
jgi:hypothetical protein